MRPAHSLTGSVAVTVIVALASCPAASAQVSFAHPLSLPVGSAPDALAAADFNADGDPDLAVANSVSDDVTILRGTIGGGFVRASTVAAGRSPSAVAVGDIDGDMHPDLAVSNFGDHSVSVLLGVPDGAFTPGPTISPGIYPHEISYPSGLALADLDGDPHLDLAVANWGSHNASILLGEPGAGFGIPALHRMSDAPQSPADGTYPQALALADLDGDADLDLTVANERAGTVSILLGEANGSFGEFTQFATGASPQSVAVDDLDGDSEPDLVTANAESNTVSVLAGTGTGAPEPASQFPAGIAPQSVAVDDFDGDSRLDLAVASAGSRSVSILVGDGAGGFAAPVHFAVGGRPHAVVAGDFNADGRADLAVANFDAGTVAILLNGPRAQVPLPAAPAPPPAVMPAPLTGKFATKLGLARATIFRRDRVLDVLAPITSRASGKVDVELHAAQRRFRFEADVDSEDGRIRFRRRIPAAQAQLGTGIVTISYPGDADTRPQKVRLRAASQRALLRLKRPAIEDGRLKARGTVSDRARGVVRLQLVYDHAGQTRTVRFRGRIDEGEWSIDERLNDDVLAQIAARSGSVHSYTLFTGYLPARMRGEMRSFQILGEP